MVKDFLINSTTSPKVDCEVKEMSKKPADVGSLKEGRYLIITEGGKDHPCRIISIDKSKPGKHGSAKARITAVGIFDGVKRTIVSPVSAKVQVPVIDKRTGQVISIMGNSLMIMDLEDYTNFEVSMPDDEDVASKITEGITVEYWNILGQKKIMRTKSS
jgi:translation initiation factor 5A